MKNIRSTERTTIRHKIWNAMVSARTQEAERMIRQIRPERG